MCVQHIGKSMKSLVTVHFQYIVPTAALYDGTVVINLQVLPFWMGRKRLKPSFF